jgi:NAD(P)H-dependent FMN reductase
MIRIIVGTNRENSRSLLVANIYQDILSSLGEPSEIINLQDLPQDFIYTALYGQNGKNEHFNEFVKKMMDAQKYVFVIAEYNGSFPGVLKAFVDGLPYPDCMMNKKAALVGLSAGEQGGMLAMSHFSDILNYMGTSVLAQRIRLPYMGKLLKDNGLQEGFHFELLQGQAKKLMAF